jgi:hypothetical protein
MRPLTQMLLLIHFVTTSCGRREREFQASHVKTETQVVANLFIEILPKLLVRSQILSLQPGTA